MKQGLLKLNRKRLGWAEGLRTGHRPPEGHLLKLGLAMSSICERCREKGEPATGYTSATISSPGSLVYFMGPGDYHDAAPMGEVPRFVRSLQQQTPWSESASELCRSKIEITAVEDYAAHPLSAKVGTNFPDKRRSV
jgi:hypothetical protein